MNNKYDGIEVNPKFQMIKTDSEISPTLQKNLGLTGEYVATTSQCTYLCRTKLTNSVYLEVFPKAGDSLGFGLDPEADWNTNLPIWCTNDEIIRHLALQVNGDEVWIYKGISDPSPFEVVDSMRTGDVPRRGSIACFMNDLGIDCDDLMEMDLSLYKSYDIFETVPYSLFDNRLTQMKNYLKENKYFGFRGSHTR